MLEYLEKLRKKPLHHRERIVLISTVLITSIIAVMWFLTIDYQFSQTNPVESKVTIDDELKPLSEIKLNLVAFFETIKQMSADVFGSNYSTTTYIAPVSTSTIDDISEVQ